MKKMMMRKFCFLAVIAAMSTMVFGASSIGIYPNSFEKPSSAALKALKATTGKPFTAGYVFVDGRYIAPPYTVQRYGTVIRINDIQVTSEIVPWNEFAKTQSGAVETRTESPVEAAAEVPSEPEPEEPEPEEESFDDSEASLDDLFDDEPSTKKKKPAAKKRTPRRAPKPKKPTVTVSYSFNGEFKHTATTIKLLKKLNDERTRIDMALRKGGYFFFGSGYQTISGNLSTAKHVFPSLISVMKANSDPDSFNNALRLSGLSYLPIALMEDLYKSRNMTRIMLERRLKADKEAKEWANLLKGGL